MLVMTTKGLYCQPGDFYIDPNGAVTTAIITHAHADHARRGSNQYYCVDSCASLLNARLGKKIKMISHPFGKSFSLGEAKISFHPAGHILGSAQIRIEVLGQVWVVSGDYKRDLDPSCERFEVVPCDVFVTEATFGTPAFSWPENANLDQEIYTWWQENARAGFHSVICAYSLGKTQRILALLKNLAVKPILCHPAAKQINECYRSEGIDLAKTICLSEVSSDDILSGELIIAPAAFLRSEDINILNNSYKTAFASGWISKTSFGYDKGFLLSDHADWNDLINTVLESQAKTVYVQHRNGALIRKLKDLGLKAFSDKHLFPRNSNQLALF